MTMTAADTAATTSPAGRVTHYEAAGWTTIIGVIIMLAGTGFWAAAGADIDVAAESNAIGEYLTDVAANGTLLTINLGIWIVGVVVISLGGIMLTRLGDQDSLGTDVARFAFTVAPAAAMVVYTTWLGIVLGLAPAYVAGASVEGAAAALVHATSLGDWVMTIPVLSLGTAAIALAGRHSWVPRWLFRWGMLTTVTGVLTAAGLIFNTRTALVMPILPVGMGFLVAAGVVAIRRSAETGDDPRS
jgi:hypothetical protein